MKELVSVLSGIPYRNTQLPISQIQKVYLL